MSSPATAPEASAPRAPTVAVVAGDPHAHPQAVRLLRDAGFSLRAGHERADVVVLVASAREDARLREVRELAETHPDAAILVIVPAGVRNTGLRRVMLAGATGIVVDEDVPRALTATASALLAGQLTVPPALGRQIAPRPLSHREKEILALLVRGKTNREIARTLFLAESTVKTHLSSAFRKMDARSRSEAVARIEDPESGFDLGVLAQAGGTGR